jgi:hypothetical protein
MDDIEQISKGAGIEVRQVSMALWIAAATQPPASRRPLSDAPADWSIVTDPEQYVPVPAPRRPVPHRPVQPSTPDAPTGPGNDAGLL